MSLDGDAGDVLSSEGDRWGCGAEEGTAIALCTLSGSLWRISLRLSAVRRPRSPSIVSFCSLLRICEHASKFIWDSRGMREAAGRRPTRLLASRGGTCWMTCSWAAGVSSVKQPSMSSDVRHLSMARNRLPSVPLRIEALDEPGSRRTILVRRRREANSITSCSRDLGRSRAIRLRSLSCTCCRVSTTFLGLMSLRIRTESSISMLHMISALCLAGTASSTTTHSSVVMLRKQLTLVAGLRCFKMATASGRGSELRTWEASSACILSMIATLSFSGRATRRIARLLGTISTSPSTALSVFMMRSELALSSRVRLSSTSARSMGSIHSSSAVLSVVETLERTESLRGSPISLRVV
mmetsp:Transcript_22197/g.73059  ORF Transcript_22197/g.73059 Transcript_22197/m.73059 type:complete len:354 (+) Transcript_22197:187-1248(+)